MHTPHPAAVAELGASEQFTHDSSDTKYVRFFLHPTSSPPVLWTPTGCPTIQLDSGTDYPLSTDPTG